MLNLNLDLFDELIQLGNVCLNFSEYSVVSYYDINMEKNPRNNL